MASVGVPSKAPLSIIRPLVWSGLLGRVIGRKILILTSFNHEAGVVYHIL